MVVDWGKLVSLITIAVAATALGITDHLAPEAVAGLLMYLAGYVTGNGRLAVKGKAPQPLFSRVLEDQEPDA